MVIGEVKISQEKSLQKLCWWRGQNTFDSRYSVKCEEITCLRSLHHMIVKEISLTVCRPVYTYVIMFPIMLSSTDLNQCTTANVLWEGRISTPSYFGEIFGNFISSYEWRQFQLGYYLCNAIKVSSKSRVVQYG